MANKAEKLAALAAENRVLREEIRVARQASELTAQLVVKQFEQTEAAQLRFRLANAQRQAVLEAASKMAIIATDLEGTVQLFNQGATALLGYTEEQVKDRCTLSDFFPVADLIERSRKAGVDFIHRVPGLVLFRHYVKQNFSAPEEWIFVRRDGTQFPASLSITPLKDADGVVVGFLAAAMDITDLKAAQEEARRNAVYLQAVLDSLPQGVCVFGGDLNLVVANPAFNRLLRLPDGFVHPGLPFEDLARHSALRGEYGPGDPERLVRQRLAVVRSAAPSHFERTMRTGDVLQIQGCPLADDDIRGFVITYTDVTLLKKAQGEAQRANDRMNEAISHSPTFVWETDAAGCFLFVQGAESVTGHTADMLLGTPFVALFFQEEETGAGEESRLDIWQRAVAARQPFRDLLARWCNRQGEPIWVAMNGKPVFDGHGVYAGYRGVNVDVTELTEARKRMESMALFDNLTGMANRNQFLERYRLELDRQRRHRGVLSLLILDIDHFKAVNDTYGHINGDICLKHLASTIVSAIRKTDLAARFGGEEFIVLLPETELNEAGQIAEKLRMRVEACAIPLQDQDQPLKITVSVGVAEMRSEQIVSFDTFLGRADQALYVAKKSGRNRVEWFVVQADQGPG
ncbi:MAG: diguanylate cyclase [Magnetococcales bacterium]|nr:diguanylate cyclase [Magnetococcales bacterium]